MKIPGFLLRETLSIEPYLGATGAGNSYGPAVSVPARVEPKRQVLRAADGGEIVSTAVAWTKPDVDAPELSRVTWRGQTLTVLTGGVMDDTYLELALGGAGQGGALL